MNTIGQLFLHRVTRDPEGVSSWAPCPPPDEADQFFLLQPTSPPHAPDGFYPATFRQVHELVAGLAQRLHSLGVTVGTPVAIVAQTSERWSAVDMAIQCLGGITVGIYPTMLPDQIRYQIEHSVAEILIVENQDQARTLTPVLEDIETLRHVLALWPHAEPVPQLTPARPNTDFLAEQIARVAPDDVSTYIYTSGTTGPPKAVVLTHQHFTTIVEASKEPLPIESGDRTVIFLPLAHVLQRFAIYRGLTEDGQGFYAPSINDLPDTLLKARPTVLATVPRMLEKIRAKVEAGAEEKGPRALAILNWAIAVGRACNSRTEAGQRPGLRLQAQYALAERLVFQKIRGGFGGEIRLLVSGGAALSPELAHWFEAVGIKVREGWGLSETCAPATVNALDDYRFGTVGRPLRDTEIRLDTDGEVLVRGPGVFREYLKDEEATRAAFTDDGFFRTGDIGAFTDDGFLKIVDRKKEIIVTAGGKNIPPVGIEQRLEGGLVGQAVVVGDDRPYLVALLAPDTEVLAARAERNGWPGGLGDWIAREDVVKEVGDQIDAANAQLARFETIKRWAVLPAPLTTETGELTPTMKIKRRVVAEKYADQIQRLYA